jgi:hypothetical protein
MIFWKNFLGQTSAIVKLSFEVAYRNHSENQEEQEHNDCDIQNVWDCIKQGSHCHFELLIARD